MINIIKGFLYYIVIEHVTIIRKFIIVGFLTNIFLASYTDSTSITIKILIMTITNKLSFTQSFEADLYSVGASLS